MAYTVRDLAPIAVMLVVATIIVSIGANVLQEIKEQQEGSDRGTSVSNESMTFSVNNTYYSTAYMPVKTVASIANDSHIIASANYTWDDQLGVKVYGGTGAPLVPGTYNVTYVYLVSLNVTESGLESVEELGEWLPTIALIVAAVIVIGTIVVYFGTGKN